MSFIVQRLRQQSYLTFGTAPSLRSTMGLCHVCPAFDRSTFESAIPSSDGAASHHSSLGLHSFIVHHYLLSAVSTLVYAQLSAACKQSLTAECVYKTVPFRGTPRESTPLETLYQSIFTKFLCINFLHHQKIIIH